MIPQRLPHRENSGNAVRYRVAACRKRLREIRVNHRLHNHLEEGGNDDSLTAQAQSITRDDEENAAELTTTVEIEAGIT
jgi:hypothetical protein